MKEWSLDRKPKLLVVDDAQDGRDLLNAYFSWMSYEVDVASDTNMGLSMCRTNEYDLVIIRGVRIAGDFNGLDLLKKIKEFDNLLPVIIVTSHNDPSELYQGLELRADDYLFARFDIRELNLRIKNIITRSTKYHKNLDLLKKKIFISYSRTDIAVAEDIYSFLKNKGCSPWMDTHNLVPGKDWKLEINRNIKSCDYFIACLSTNSVSKRGYVQKELKEALSVLDEIPEGQIFLIPIKIDNCIVPVSLEDKHWLDWFAPNAKELLTKAIESS